MSRRGPTTQKKYDNTKTKKSLNRNTSYRLKDLIKFNRTKTLSNNFNTCKTRFNIMTFCLFIYLFPPYYREKVPPREDIQWTGYKHACGILENADVSLRKNNKMRGDIL